MSADEDNELRDLIIKTLENKGILAKLKAELRASVFQALEDQEETKDVTNPKLAKFAGTEDGIIALSLVRELLERLQLDYTLAVFDPEISTVKSKLLSKEHLVKKCGKLESDSSVPLLGSLVHSAASDPKSSQMSGVQNILSSRDFAKKPGSGVPTSTYDDLFPDDPITQDHTKSLFSISVSKPLPSDQTDLPFGSKNSTGFWNKNNKEFETETKTEGTTLLPPAPTTKSAQLPPAQDPKFGDNEEEIEEEIACADLLESTSEDVTSDASLHSSLKYDYMENLDHSEDK